MDRALELPALVLLDEVGSGTDPIEGGALGTAAIEHFRQRGAIVVATTHDEALKSYAATTPGVATGGFGFDAETFAPSYRLIYGAPGRSLAHRDRRAARHARVGHRGRARAAVRPRVAAGRTSRARRSGAGRARSRAQADAGRAARPRRRAPAGARARVAPRRARGRAEAAARRQAEREASRSQNGSRSHRRHSSSRRRTRCPIARRRVCPRASPRSRPATSARLRAEARAALGAIGDAIADSPRPSRT